MAGRGTRATATDYNAIQSTVASILGVGSGTTGYGQPITSAQVAAGAVISVAQWSTLRTDLGKCRVHQTNSAIIDGLASVTANRGTPWQTLQVINSSTTISEDIRDQYNQFSTGINTNRAVAAAGQLTAGNALITSSRATNWGGGALAQSVSHVFTVTFAGYTSGSLTVSAADHMRCFFNAGGSIQIAASRTGTAANTKDTDWTNMLAASTGVNVINFSNSATALTAPSTLNAGGVLNSGFGFASTTSTPTAIVTQTSSVSKYAENRYIVSVARPTTNTLQFTVLFQDNDAGDRPSPAPPAPFGPLVDEPVTGTLATTITCTSPTGANVAVPSPTAATNTALTVG
jgi:hypothetical protein